MQKNRWLERVAFVPDEMVHHEIEMLKAALEGWGLGVFNESVELLIEQFKLDEKTAITLQSDYRKAMLFFYDYADGKIRMNATAAYNHLYEMFTQYHLDFIQETQFKYNVKRAATAEIGMYQSFVNGNIKQMMCWTQIYFEILYGLPAESLTEATQARESALTIVRGGMSDIPLTEKSWHVIEKSLNNYYNLLLQSIVSAYQIELS